MPLSLHVFTSTTNALKMTKVHSSDQSLLRVDSNPYCLLNELLPVLLHFLKPNLSGTQVHVCCHAVLLKTLPLSPGQFLLRACPSFLLPQDETETKLLLSCTSVSGSVPQTCLLPSFFLVCSPLESYRWKPSSKLCS